MLTFVWCNDISKMILHVFKDSMAFYIETYPGNDILRKQIKKIDIYLCSMLYWDRPRYLVLSVNNATIE